MRRRASTPGISEGRSRKANGQERETQLVPTKRRVVLSRRRHLLRSAGGTLCIPRQVCLLSRYMLVLTCVVCLEILEEQLYSFRARWRLRSSSCVSGPPKTRHSSTANARYAIQVAQIRPQCLNSGNYLGFQPHSRQYHNKNAKMF